MTIGYDTTIRIQNNFERSLLWIIHCTTFPNKNHENPIKNVKGLS